MIPGIDVSNNNGRIDWDKVAAAGYQFAAIKVSEGETFTDSYAPYNWSEAKRVGMGRIAYHLTRFDRGTTVQGELARFKQSLPAPLERGDCLMGDFEYGQSVGPDPHLAFLQGAQAMFGPAPLLYSARWFMDPAGISGDARFAPYGLYLAAYGSVQPTPPAPWSLLALWQYSDTGRVPGVATDCDLDLFFGTLEQLKQYGYLGAAPQPAPAPADMTNDDVVQAVRFLLDYDAAGAIAYLQQFQGAQHANAARKPARFPGAHRPAAARPAATAPDA